MGMALGLQAVFRQTMEREEEMQLVKVQEEASMLVKLQQVAQQLQHRPSWRNLVFATW